MNMPENGQEVEIKPRKIEIYSIELININNKDNEIEFKVKCSKGTYIRTLCEDITERLDNVGYMSSLERIEVDRFNINNSVTIEEIEKLDNENQLKFIEKHLITIEEIFKDQDKLELNDKNLYLFLNGVQLNYKIKEGIYRIYHNTKFIGTGTIKNNLLKRDIII